MRPFDRINGALADRKKRAVILWAAVSLAMALFLLSTNHASRGDETSTEIAASKSMESALKVLREEYLSRGLRFDDSIDPNHTGLIGPEYTEMVTTLGSADAKRSTTNPYVAGLIVRLLSEAGVRRGDTIAIGCSGSFPALAVASLIAAKGLGVHAVTIISLGSSSFGADRVEWSLLDILETLKATRCVNASVSGVSLGGARDVGSEFEPETRSKLIEKVRSYQCLLIQEADLRQNVARRMQIYAGSKGSAGISAFVNIGGSRADLGTDPLILKLEPGVNRIVQLPAEEERYGVVFAMAKRHIPVVHLLHIKGLLLKYGLPWDPTPLPVVQTEIEPSPRLPFNASLVAAALLYGVLILAIFTVYRKEFFRTSSSRSRS
jgi:poly-gamma-glutamate system protein